MPNFTNLAATSAADGFKNYSSVSFSASIASQNIAAGGYATASASTPLNNANAVSQVQVQFSGVNSFWQVLTGSIYQDVPDSASMTYEIEAISYFTGGNAKVDTYIINETAGTISIPAITINCRAFLFLAPF